MAVALPESDPQDRLRVLSKAAEVVSPIDRVMAKNLWREGVQIEAELIRVGQKPAVSMMASGQADCSAARNFVENLPQGAIVQAEQSLVGALTTCPGQTLDPVARKLDVALEKNIAPPRALLAAMEAEGTKSAWSQAHFEKVFNSLPDPRKSVADAQNFAALYARMAGEVDGDSARKSGLELLVWLGKMDDTPQRVLAINTTTGAMRQALGEEAYKQALQSDVAANTTAQNPGQAQKIERPPNQGVSVLEAMRDVGHEPATDRTEQLRNLPPGERAREAAAFGFAAGAGGDKAQAGKYFDLAFAALDDAWDTRTAESNVEAVVQEVGEAAAQVDSVNALERARKLHDPSAQAIAMLAVARVVGSNGLIR